MKVGLSKTPVNEQTEIDLSAIKSVPTGKTDCSSTTCSSTTCSSTTAVCSDTTECSSTTESQRVNKWRQEKRDTIRVDVARGTKAVLQNEATKRGISLTQMIKDALRMYLANTQ